MQIRAPFGRNTAKLRRMEVDGGAALGCHYSFAVQLVLAFAWPHRVIFDRFNVALKPRSLMAGAFPFHPLMMSASTVLARDVPISDALGQSPRSLGVKLSGLSIQIAQLLRDYPMVWLLWACRLEVRTFTANRLSFSCQSLAHKRSNRSA
jgi:hypothetical protein